MEVAREREVAEPHDGQTFGNGDSLQLGLDHDAQREEVRAAEDGVDVGMPRQQIEELKVLSRDKKDIPESFAGVKKITGDELKSWIDQKKDFVLLDNRVPADYEKERIAGAKRLSPDDLMEKGLKAAEALGLKKTDTIAFY